MSTTSIRIEDGRHRSVSGASTTREGLAAGERAVAVTAVWATGQKPGRTNVPSTIMCPW
jgi:hypothetical protein